MKINKGRRANDKDTPRNDSASGFYEPAAGKVVSLQPPHETFNANVIFFSHLPSSKTPFIREDAVRTVSLLITQKRLSMCARRVDRYFMAKSAGKKTRNE